MNLDVEFDRMMRKVAELTLDPIRRFDAISFMDKSRDWNERRSWSRDLIGIGKKNELSRTAEDFAREFERDVDRGWNHVMPRKHPVGSLPHSLWPETANSPRSAPAPLQPASNTPKPVAPSSKPVTPAASIPPAASVPKPSAAAPTPSPAASIPKPAAAAPTPSPAASIPKPAAAPTPSPAVSMPKPAAIPTASIPKPVGGGVPGPGIGASVSAAAGKVKSFAKMNPRLAVGVPLLDAGAYAAHRLFRKKPKQEEAKMASSNLDAEFDRMMRKVAGGPPLRRPGLLDRVVEDLIEPRREGQMFDPRDPNNWDMAQLKQVDDEMSRRNRETHFLTLHAERLAEERLNAERLKAERLNAQPSKFPLTTPSVDWTRPASDAAQGVAETSLATLPGPGLGARAASFMKAHPYATGAAIAAPVLAAGGYGAYKYLKGRKKQEAGEEKMAMSNLDVEFDRMLHKVKVAGLSFANDARQELRGLYPEWDKRDLDTRQLHEYLVSQGMDHRAHNRLNFGWDDIADELNAKPSKFPLDTTSVNWTRPAADAAQGVAETALAKYKPGLGERISGFAKAHPYATGAAIAAPVLAAGGYGAYKYLNKKPKQQGEEEKTSSLHMLYPSFFEEFSLLTQAHAQNK